MITMREKQTVAGAMAHYGSKFEQGLAVTLHWADPENTRVIKETWPDVWIKFLEIGKREDF